MTPTDFQTDVRLRLRQWQQRLLWQRLLHTLAVVSVFLLAARLFAVPSTAMLQQAAVIGLAWFSQLWVSKKWRRLNPNNFLQHLNRRFPDFEESTHLLLRDETQLKALQVLQRERVYKVYQDNLAQLSQWQPQIRYTKATTILISCLLLALFSDQLRSLSARFVEDISSMHTQSLSPDQTSGIKTISVQVKPPAYTGLDSTRSEQLDLEIMEGSQVLWTLSFDNNDVRYALRLSPDQRVEFSPAEKDFMSASATISKTALYHIVKLGTEDEEPQQGIHSLTVTRDQAPAIRLIEPDVSKLEIPKNAPARFSSQALVNDDFGIASVDILASVAKGSGEAVKFRDHKLDFDDSIKTDKGTLYRRDWDLRALGMTPGDEIYFTVTATDNKLPQANSTRSASLIVRWLDEEEAAVAAEGLTIDFIPEFFKSQRQIIIDTEQLIKDRAQLHQQEFKDSAYAIGQAQAGLKQRYGQYLGDEFGEGPGEQLGVVQEIADAEHEKEGQHEEAHAPAGSSNANNNINNTADILRLYGHDHGDPEIGPITKQNPVAMMKRAVSKMWQAEKHLMQAEPEQALPFEYEAYNDLKLARQADRIYVKRLGFVPPPVSEDRRLQGELDEILSYRTEMGAQTFDRNGKQWNQLLLRDVYQLLTTYILGSDFSDKERQQLHQLSDLLTTGSELAPALIQQAATVEKLLLAGQLKLENCQGCIGELRTALWNLMDESSAELRHRKAARQPTDSLVRSYQQMLTEASGRAAEKTGDGQ